MTDKKDRVLKLVTSSEMTEKEEEFLENFLDLCYSFTSNRINERYIRKIIDVMGEESLNHGDRAEITINNLRYTFNSIMLQKYE
jgi:hypothetical protein